MNHRHGRRGETAYRLPSTQQFLQHLPGLPRNQLSVASKNEVEIASIANGQKLEVASGEYCLIFETGRRDGRMWCWFTFKKQVDTPPRTLRADDELKLPAQFVMTAEPACERPDLARALQKRWENHLLTMNIGSNGKSRLIISPVVLEKNSFTSVIKPSI